MATKYPTRVEELPSDEFLAVLLPASVTIPGDERSRTTPGHGYPEHTVEYWSMEVFSSRDEWESRIEQLESKTGYARRPYKAIRAFPAKVKTRVEIE